ncbi:LysR family transcriptional regulator [Paracidovorax avenae]|uniref:LysR family transcriptional regulator n=1 Tax=Paracidovorax avenae TaxID=80867 RepID=UPI000D224429|nr:LysR family transcriptional regulator [Paracidovorax avenae]AVT06591.1 LysR family transcriptional regulator [Paracidovorax avenae]AVT13187.1 LysR family transcriptional regulator [Paracidovorax avenae]
MIELDDLRMVRALGSCGSLAGAARLLDLTPPALTVRLKRLEGSLGIHLAVRGARGITFTDEGRRLLEEAKDVLERVESLPGRIGSEAHAMAGRLRVAAPFGFGRQYMARIVRATHLAHPALAIALQLSEHPLRDAAAHDVVIHIGMPKDSSWIGHLLAPNDRLLCASPAFVRRLEAPLVHPSQLADQPCLCLAENDEDVTRWRFLPSSAGQEGPAPRKGLSVRVAGRLSSNDGTVVTQWALDGLGIVARSEWEAGPLIAEGRLVRLLPGWHMEAAPVMALTPVRNGVPARLRVFIEACRAALDPVPWRAGSCAM